MALVNHYLGAFVDDAAANAYVAATGWPEQNSSGRTTLVLVNGLMYYNTTTAQLVTRANGAWISAEKVSQVAWAAADDATPTVANGVRVLFIGPNTAPLAITNLDNGAAGQVVTIVCMSTGNPPTVADAGNFALSGAFVGALDASLTLVLDGAVWRELAVATP
jgi:hypothetical protein